MKKAVIFVAYTVTVIVVYIYKAEFGWVFVMMQHTMQIQMLLYGLHPKAHKRHTKQSCIGEVIST